ncbi:unnamed protein product, partial [Didymodactylos carnosus]
MKVKAVSFFGMYKSNDVNGSQSKLTIRRCASAANYYSLHNDTGDSSTETAEEGDGQEEEKRNNNTTFETDSGIGSLSQSRRQSILTPNKIVASSSSNIIKTTTINNTAKQVNKSKNLFRRLFQSRTSVSKPVKRESVAAPFSAYGQPAPLIVTQGPLRAFVIRHGERLDRYYSSQWLKQAFDQNGNYCRFSPVLPETLPLRNPVSSYDLDTPLSYKGITESFLTGTVLRTKQIQINYCYSSPAIRCIQTATKLLEGLQLQNKVKIRIEPGLFECTGWYLDEISGKYLQPQFMTKDELIASHYPIDKSYKEHLSLNVLAHAENELEYYERSHLIASVIMKQHEQELINHIQADKVNVNTASHVLLV